ncbi:MAG: outer membrane homotrimeric porin [Desulfovibrio sp.]|nr:outer membrane homotrimeric porin [Desulfovibrio sp.]
MGILCVLCMPMTASAVDFKIKGVWINMFEYGDGGNFIKKDRNGNQQQGWGRWGEDQFEAKNRVRLQLNAVASENLSGTVYFEIGAITWGRANKGGALGADGTNIVKIKHSYLDWTLSNTSIHTRMGLQRIFLPDYVTEASQVFDADGAGVSVSVPFNDIISLSAFWALPFNDNWDGGNDANRVNYLDYADLFGVTLPLSFDGFRLTPWAMLGAFGHNAFRDGAGTYYSRNRGGSYGLSLAPTAYAVDGKENTYSYTTAIWAGLTGEFTAADPFRLAWSFNYGSVDTGEEVLNRRGWYAALLAEYKFDWGTPGVYGWYSSGDDDDPTNGSERLPNIEGNNESTSGLTNIATMGTWTLGRDGVIGTTLAGTWGLGLRVRDFSFIDKLTHTLHVNYYQGTNSSDMARYVKGAPSRYNITRPDRQDFTSNDFFGLYLTDQDKAFEVGLKSQYQIYENLKLLVEANYIALWLDNSSSVWGGFTDDTGAYRHANSTEDLWNVNVSFIYKF